MNNLKLGECTDQQYADANGISRSSAANLRKKSGIKPKKKSHNWLNNEIDLLGTMSDTDLSKKIGITPTAVKHKRRRLKIMPFNVRIQPRLYMIAETTINSPKPLSAVLYEDARKLIELMKPILNVFFKENGLPHPITTQDIVHFAIGNLYRDVIKKRSSFKKMENFIGENKL